MPRFHFHIFRIPGRARLQVICRFLIRSIQRSPYFPTQATALTGFVLGEFARHLVEFGAISQLRQGFFFLGMFLALGSQSVFFSMQTGRGEADVPKCDEY